MSEEKARPAIILAAFGSSEPEALAAVFNVEKIVRERFPAAEVAVAFTSAVIRKIWRKRGFDANFRAAWPDLPAWLYDVVSPLTAAALAAEDGPRPIYMQSLHINNGEEFADLAAAAARLSEIDYVRPRKSPFKNLRLGLSAFGRGRPAELAAAAAALAPLAREAEGRAAALVLMGHGAIAVSNQVYVDFEATLRAVYGRPVYIGLAEGEPGFETLLARLKSDGPARVFLAPLMLVAGDHARNDMAGPAADSWVNRLKAAGLSVETRLAGLGSLDSWAELYVERLRAIYA
ncbi:MAG: sirohydrochlorin cobaltochelatase [Candidatus Adiutrix sp.]|jgi:sirohydrochlorin cobaltochelatase|nr:sirohydrochlorin cobaltochelatase [Candidatus Adiutrix sp.]